MDNYSELRPNVGVTVVPMTFNEQVNDVMVLVYRRPKDSETFADKLAMPNGFMNIKKHETLEDAANDALREKTGVALSHFSSFNSFSGAHIDPRRITVNVGFISLHNASEIEFGISEHIGEPEWISMEKLLSLKQEDFAFNHYEVLSSSWNALREIAKRTSHHAKMLDKDFSIYSFQKLTERILGKKLNNKSFRNKLDKFGVLIDTGKTTPKNSNMMGAPKALFNINPEHDGTFLPE